jgi:hypothetical protein
LLSWSAAARSITPTSSPFSTKMAWSTPTVAHW